MGYVESNLGEGERVLARVTHSKTAVFSAVIGAVFTFALVFAISSALGYFSDYLLSLGAPSEVDSIFFIIRIAVIVVGIILGICRILDRILQIKCNQLIVTNKKLFGRSGWISKTVTDMPLTKLDNIQVENGFFGAIFHYGELVIVSAGSQSVVGGNTVNNLKYPYVKNTEEFRHAVLAAIEKAKEEEREAQAIAQAEAIRRAQEIMQKENR